ncbi:Heme A synthase [Candidatus Trichorickettsia mobilis]|uniref:Heme A synthase n=1 Tax=Candidatus Trichorickettsia mobilis TaxID=1346319 RepID=A0ABZ0UQD7_9RICK|nr:COX15/CtaA family protein [Candidatus Trichorickettsia mobilis]WPY00260.1 Heme A synthase [Candidatus Trichorickettsia mobilis]
MLSLFNQHQKNYLIIWLSICSLMVILMIFLGGLTRLTNSGLSIVEWKPISGIIPPLTDNHWLEEFAKYQLSPEYLQLNNSMSLAEFKFIFWLEFVHRLAGRVTGLVYLLPLLYFYRQGIIARTTKVYPIILLLFAVQGFIGWYMVKSGLEQMPYVSHFRLALHLIIAFIIYTLLFWQLMINSCKNKMILPGMNLQPLRLLCGLSLAMMYLQIIIGGLTAGLDAGLVYNSFPLMGTKFIAEEISISTIGFESLNDPVFIQFLHRSCAYLIIVTVSMIIFKLCYINNSKLRIINYCIILALILQVSAGILTIIYAVPISLALIHQIGAVILLSCLLWCYYSISSYADSVNNS